ncbi:hypothetical protein [Naumannella halotolerans]|nr:hypothetical protein [Naumannella halotolerans]
MSRASAGCAALALFLGGCAGGDDPLALTAQRDGASVVMVQLSDPGGGMEAAFSGTVTVTRDGCWTFDDEAPLVFPAGTDLVDDGRAVELSDGTVTRLGDQVRFGGGFVDIDSRSGVAAECADGDSLILWQ